MHQALLGIAARAWRRLYYVDDLTGPGRRIVYASAEDLDHGVRLVLDIETTEPDEFDIVAIQPLDTDQVDYIKRHHVGPPPV